MRRSASLSSSISKGERYILAAKETGGRYHVIDLAILPRRGGVTQNHGRGAVAPSDKGEPFLQVALHSLLEERKHWA
ncbi:MAG: hypothetical protein ACTSX7_18865 [Alphaproteobacteria bacterium]